jgi:RNA polymerase primary sigma factor
MSDILNDYLQSLYKFDVLPVEEEHRLSALIQQGDTEALNVLVHHNLRFVVYVVSKMTAWKHSNVSSEDLISMGNEQLIISAKRWIPTNNAKFATYAKSFIARGVNRELDNTANMIRLPVNVMQSVKKMRYTERTLTNTLGRKPKAIEIALAMGISEDMVMEYKTIITHEPESLDQMEDALFMEDNDE